MLVNLARCNLITYISLGVLQLSQWDFRVLDLLIDDIQLNYRLYMMTSSNGDIFRVTGPLCGVFTGPGEFPAQRPVMRSIDIFFGLHPSIGFRLVI